MDINKTSFLQLRKVKVKDENIAFIAGLPANIAEESILTSENFLGQYGCILKISINQLTSKNQTTTWKPVYCAHVTYSHSFSVALLIYALDGFVLNDNRLKASYGLTKYCTFFL